MNILHTVDVVALRRDVDNRLRMSNICSIIIIIIITTRRLIASTTISFEISKDSRFIFSISSMLTVQSTTADNFVHSLVRK